MATPNETPALTKPQMAGCQQEPCSEILERLSIGMDRDIYRAAQGGDFWITYKGGGPYSGRVVADLVASGKLVEKYKGCECYCLPNVESIHPETKP